MVFIALSCAVRNGDAHLKNFGVLYAASNQSVRLSPAFDIVSTTPYIKGDSMALTMEGSKRFPTRKKLLNFARIHCNLQPAKAQEILEQVGEAITDTMSDLQHSLHDFKGFEPIGKAMLMEWNGGLNDSLLKPSGNH